MLTCLLIQNSHVTVSYYLYAMQYLSIDVYGCSWMFLRHGARSGLYPSQQTADEITDSADDKLFDCVLRNDDHVLHELLSKRVDIAYNLRTRCHDRTIPEK